MAEQYIADVVRKGAKAIQRWRQDHPGVPIMLVGLDLSGLNLVGADLSGANLSGCNLHLSIMISVNLSNAKLSGAKLRGANLVGANLSSADLQKAVLTGTILQNANLENADLRGANLRRADLRGALMRGAQLDGADMQDAVMTESEYAQIRGEGAAPAGGLPEVDEEDTIGFVLQLAVVISAVELARLLKAMDDIHVLLNLGPVRVEQTVINLDSGEPSYASSVPPNNRLVVALNRSAAAWLVDSMDTRLQQLKSDQARILRYKKLGLSEEEVWHNVRPALEEGSDPLGVLRELMQKQVLLSCGPEDDAAAMPSMAPSAPAASTAPRASATGAAPSVPPVSAPETKRPTQGGAPAPSAEPPAVSGAEPSVPETGGGEAEELDAYIRRLDSADWGTRAAAAEALGNLGSDAQAAMPYLMKTVEDENIFVREAAEDAIKKITEQS